MTKRTNVKKYIVKDMREAKEQILRELGPEAYIVTQQEVRQPGMMGLFKPKQLEVTAVLEEKVEPPKPKKSKVNANAQQAQRIAQLLGSNPNFERVQQAMNQSTPFYDSRAVSPEAIYSAIPPHLAAYTQENANMAAYLASSNPVVQHTTEMGVLQTAPEQLSPQPVKVRSVVEQAYAQTQPSLPSAPPVEVPVKAEEKADSTFPIKTQADLLQQAQESRKQPDLEQEMAEIKSLLQRVVGGTTAGNVVASDEISQNLETLFADFDFSEKMKQQFKEYVQTLGRGAEAINRTTLYQFVQREIQQRVQIGHDIIEDISALDLSNPIVASQIEPQIKVFVGPPGVGKTTTIAKVASEAIMRGWTVGFVTIDIYRIGAVEQLRKYADILGMEIEVVPQPDGMMPAIERLKAKGCQFIIVDSIGRSHRDEGNLEELNTLLLPAQANEIYLVLNLSTKLRELLKILDNFSFMNYTHLIFTKLDECERNENILNLYYETTCPVSYLCTGQEVPFDIEKATLNRIMEFVWGGGEL